MVHQMPGQRMQDLPGIDRMHWPEVQGPDSLPVDQIQKREFQRLQNTLTVTSSISDYHVWNENLTSSKGSDCPSGSRPRGDEWLA